MSQEVHWLNKYIVRSLCAHNVDSVITERWHEGEKDQNCCYPARAIDSQPYHSFRQSANFVFGKCNVLFALCQQQSTILPTLDS